MARFQISMNGPGVKALTVPLGRTIKLVQAGGDPKGLKLDVALEQGTSGVEIKVLADKLAGAATGFTISGSVPGPSCNIRAYLPGTGRTKSYCDPLEVTIGGRPQRQPGYTVDLLSEMARVGSSEQVYAYHRIITDNIDDSHILTQDTRIGHYNCGDVAAAYGKRFFGTATYTEGRTYYRKLTSNRIVDLRFEPQLVRHGIERIRSLLAQGTSVRVWLVHHDGFSTTEIRRDPRTHYLTIVGYSRNNRFLFLNPWPKGSSLEYSGGVFAPRHSAFMGELAFDPSNLDRGIFSPFDAMGRFPYTVIAGP